MGPVGERWWTLASVRICMAWADGDATEGTPSPGLVSTDGSGLDSVQHLSPRVKLFWGVPWLVFALLIAIVTGLVGVAARWGLPGTGGAVVVVLVVLGVPTVLVPRVRYQRWTYRVTADQLEVAHGIWVRRESSVPHFRVQHVDIRQGPLQRLAGVVELRISTASPATDAALPGLEPAHAEVIRTLVLARAGADDAV
jgi:membrane protein YdbS with pleckstrin-like domain